METLANHLEQIALSANSIAELEFPPPKIFTNALLGDHEITALIRDTEPHERSLFSLDPEVTSRTPNQGKKQSIGVSGHGNGNYTRKTVYPNSQTGKPSAVARVLGSEMLLQIRQSSGNAVRSKGDVNVEVLLRGAEKLCDVYAVDGVPEKISAIRHRHRHIAASVAEYEEKVARQQVKLERLNQGLQYDGQYHDEEAETWSARHAARKIPTDRDFQTEEALIKELEARKTALEDQVAGMERDLGGLLR